MGAIMLRISYENNWCDTVYSMKKNETEEHLKVGILRKSEKEYCKENSIKKRPFQKKDSNAYCKKDSNKSVFGRDEGSSDGHTSL